MEPLLLTRAAFSLLLVLALIWGIAWLMQRMGWDKKLKGMGRTSRTACMAVTEVLYLDPKRKLMLVQVRDQEICLLMTGEHATVLSQHPVMKETHNA